MQILNYREQSKADKDIVIFDIEIDTGGKYGILLLRNWKLRPGKKGGWWVRGPSFKVMKEEGGELYPSYIEFSAKNEFIKDVLEALKPYCKEIGYKNPF